MKHGRSLLVAAALLGAALPAVPATAGPKPDLLGAARLFSQEKVIVVYPAGTGRSAEINRISAERRAAYLEVDWDVEARIVADDAITEEQLAGNLLVLGWDNRLIGTPRMPSPLSSAGTHRAFLGSIQVLADEDLLYGVASPYNPESWLFFWSRIDAERDRFLVLPFLGSDWGVYRDYRPVDQGMFDDPTQWPPARNLIAEMSHRDKIPPPSKDRSEHFVLHGKLSDEEAQQILSAREKSLAKAIRELGDPGEGFVIGLYVYRDNEDKETITGVPASAHSIPGRREIHMTKRMARSLSPREEVNVLAARIFGPCSVTAFHDGLMTLVELPPGIAGLPLYAAMLLDQDQMPRIDELLDEEALRKLLHQRVGLTAAGLLVSWLREVGGRELLARAYPSLEIGAAELAGWIGISQSEAEAAFRNWVGALAETAQTELEFRKAQERAREQRLMGDRAAEAALLVDALKLKPDDPETLYKLSLALIESEQYREAQRRLLRLVDLTVGPGETRYVIFGYYQLGRAYESLQDRKKAEGAYERMLELPDEHDAHRMAREALEQVGGMEEGDEMSPLQ